MKQNVVESKIVVVVDEYDDEDVDEDNSLNDEILLVILQQENTAYYKKHDFFAIFHHNQKVATLREQRQRYHHNDREEVSIYKNNSLGTSQRLVDDVVDNNGNCNDDNSTTTSISSSSTLSSLSYQPPKKHGIHQQQVKHLNDRPNQCRNSIHHRQESDSFGGNVMRNCSKNKCKMTDVYCRTQMIQWCFQLTQYLQYRNETVEIAVSILDRFMMIMASSSLSLDKETTATKSATTTDDTIKASMNLRYYNDDVFYNRQVYQLVSMTSLYIAIKVHETSSVDLYVMEALSRGAVTVQQMEQMEYIIFNALQWKIHPPTSTSFLRQYIQKLYYYYDSIIATELSKCSNSNSNRKEGNDSDDEEYVNNDYHRPNSCNNSICNDFDDVRDNDNSDCDDDYEDDDRDSLFSEIHYYGKLQCEYALYEYKFFITVRASFITYCAILNAIDFAMARRRREEHRQNHQFYRSMDVACQLLQTHLRNLLFSFDDNHQNIDNGDDGDFSSSLYSTDRIDKVRLRLKKALLLMLDRQISPQELMTKTTLMTSSSSQAPSPPSDIDNSISNTSDLNDGSNDNGTQSSSCTLEYCTTEKESLVILIDDNDKQEIEASISSSSSTTSSSFSDTNVDDTNHGDFVEDHIVSATTNASSSSGLLNNLVQQPDKLLFSSFASPRTTTLTATSVTQS